MPAKFVNLFQFFESQVPAEVEMEHFFAGCAYFYGIIAGFDLIDIGPEEELARGDARDRNARVVEGQQLLGAESPFAPGETAIRHAERQVDRPGHGVMLRQHQSADAAEENDLDHAKE